MQRASSQALVTVALVMGLGVSGMPPVASAKLTGAQKCAAAKLKAAAKKADGKVKCHAKTGLVAAADPACLQKAEDKFTTGFTNAEKPAACKESGDAVAIEARVDTFVDALVSKLRPPAGALKPTQKCAATKIKAASKKAVAKTTCQTKNLSVASAGLLAICYGSAEDRFGSAFAKAEAPGSCATSGDATDVEATVDTFVGDIAQALIPPTPTPTPGPPPTPCGGFVDNGNGTISDPCTGLMWEKKDQSSDGVHDMNLHMPWSGTCSVGGALCQQSTATNPSGLCLAEADGGTNGCALCGAGTCNTTGPGVVTAWGLAAYLNAVNFAGHTDWRLPTVAELQTIVDTSVPSCDVPPYRPCVPAAFDNNCTPGCTVTTCSCTQLATYWSATTDAERPDLAREVYFTDGSVDGTFKKYENYVRAVRGGL